MYATGKEITSHAKLLHSQVCQLFHMKMIKNSETISLISLQLSSFTEAPLLCLMDTAADADTRRLPVRMYEVESAGDSNAESTKFTEVRGKTTGMTVFAACSSSPLVLLCSSLIRFI